MKYTDIATADWKWPHFTPAGIACRGSGDIVVVPAFLDLLEALRDKLARPLTINCAYRSPLHNARVGGAPLSEHKFGKAADIALGGIHKADLIAAARAVGFTGLGVNYSTFLHVDIGPRRQW
jgi:uncharacterized protein YcbK (DUF882 family)